MALRDILVHFTTVVDQKPLDDTQKKTDKLLETFRRGVSVLQGFAAALAVREAVNFVKDTVAMADGMVDLAARLGVTTDELQILNQVAKEAGAGAGAVQMGFRTLAAQMAANNQEFARLGVATKNADGSSRALLDVFFDVGGALGDTADGSKRLAIAQKLLGESGLQLLPAFTGGAEAVAKMREEMSDYAVVVDAEFAAAADKAQKELDIFSARLARLRVLFVSQVLPAFRAVVRALETGVTAINKWVRSGSAMNALMAAGATAFLRWAGGVRLGLSAAGRLLPLVKTLWRLLMRFILPALVIDELITLFRGGDTVIGRFIDSLFGVGATAAAVEMVKGAASSLWDTMGLVIDRTFDTGEAGEMSAEQFESAFLRASQGIGEAFDVLFEGISKAQADWFEAWKMAWGDLADWYLGFWRGVVDSIREKIMSIPGVGAAIKAFSEMESPAAVNSHPVFGASALSSLGGLTGLGGDAIAAITPTPALSPAATARVGTTVLEDSRQQNITVNVEGSATPHTAREVGRAAANAVGKMGRDLNAIGASVGLT